MYQEKMAVAIKHGGKVLREFKDTVYIPFGSEYSFLIKNLHARRAVVHIEIDGQNVTKDGLVVNANSSVDLERFITDNLSSGNKFKFIERNSKVEEHRGVGVEDGLIRVEFEFERESVKRDWFNGVNWTNTTWNSPPIAKGADAIADKWLNSTTCDYSKMPEYYAKCLTGSVTASASTTFASALSDYVPQMLTNSVNDVGITVPGSLSEQKFVTTHINTDGVKHVMVLKLLGETDNGKVEAPVTVKSKPKCVTCGHLNKSAAKFCTECGAGLVIY